MKNQKTYSNMQLIETVAKAIGINLEDLKKDGVRPFYGKLGDTSDFISSKEMEMLNTKMKVY